MDVIKCGVKGEKAAATLTVRGGFFLWEVVDDGFARSLGVCSRVPVLLQLLLRHQVRLQLPVQCGSYRATNVTNVNTVPAAGSC